MELQEFSRLSPLQNLEYVYGFNYQYLKIPKNGVTQTIACIENTISDKNLLENTVKHPSLLSWTIIRDPYKRFISGLAYDILRNYPHFTNFQDFFISQNLNDLFFNKSNIYSRAHGHSSHTSLQITYLYNQNLDYYVRMEDLSIFHQTHFKDISIKENKGSKKFKKELKLYLDLNSDLKNIINNYLSIDYYLINSIKKGLKIWKWQDGKIF